jgi:hypothetical protein
MLFLSTRSISIALGLTGMLGVRRQLVACQSDQRLESREVKLGGRFAFTTPSSKKPL